MCPTAEDREKHINYGSCPYCNASSTLPGEFISFDNDHEIGCNYQGYECEVCGKYFAVVLRPIGIIPLDQMNRWQGSSGFISRGKIKSDRIIHPTDEML